MQKVIDEGRIEEVIEDVVEGIKDIIYADFYVNGVLIHMVDRTPTGHQIKVAAIRQDVHISENFVLQQELPDGTSKIIGDTEHVRVRDGLRFTAIAPDDNS